MKKNNSENGRNYWRSLDQLADTPEFRTFLHNEFPKGTAEMAQAEPENSWSRRNFLTLMGASLAIAGLASCRKPVERIIPYVERPEGESPGNPISYATTMPCGNSALGMLVTSHDGRPTKVEGNPEHPSSAGATNVVMQASILGLYDPDRSTGVRKGEADSDWQSFVRLWANRIAPEHSDGDGLAILSESFSSPTLWRLRQEFMKKYPKARWIGYEAISDEEIYRGTELAFGKRYQPIYDLNQADVIVSLDADFLNVDTDTVRMASGFADGRRVLSESDGMSRLYAIEAAYSATGALADHRFRMPSSQIAAFALALGIHMNSIGLRIKALDGLNSLPPRNFKLAWVAILAEELLSNKGRSVIIAGRRQPAVVHALACVMNTALGNDGVSVHYVEPKDNLGSSREDFASLAKDMKAGKVKTLIMMGGNPVYNAPAELDFAQALGKVTTSVHLSSHFDETSELCGWHINRSHFLESWGDARAIDGTASIIQPLIEPLHGGHSDVELATLIATDKAGSGYDSVRETWKKLTGSNFEKKWRRALHDGLLTDSGNQKKIPKIKSSAVKSSLRSHTFAAVPSGGAAMELAFQNSHMGDGRSANNGWLQELPDSISRLAWDNAAMLSVETAKGLGLENEDMVRLSVNGHELEMPVWISPGQAENCVAVTLGYGRTKAGRIGDGVGFNTFALRGLSGSDFISGLTLTKTGKTYQLANVQDHGSMEGRPIVREATLLEYQNRKDKDPFMPAQIPHPPLLALWDEHKYDTGNQWGMSIDLNSCTGCNACVIACQSENNIPIVGKDEVRLGREMHWIRIDRYYVGDDLNDPDVVVQPVTCQHCENAPCETVCPVGATLHDDEGLNVMVYNRCIGTRYCSNNCPYKVRRFNYYNLTKDKPELERMGQNPEVTVRSRGVMEKCTYCVQRISKASIAAKVEGREMVDGDVVTACQQACPTNAIIFGNIRDKESKVAKMKAVTRSYDLLEELFTKPRTSYLGRLRNPNPELKT